MTIFIIVALFVAVKRLLLSNDIKNVIVTRLEAVTEADHMDISSLNIILDKIYINNLVLRKNSIEIHIAYIEIDYSPFKLFSKGINFKEWVQRVSIEGVYVTLSGDGGDVGENQLVNYEQYSDIVSKLSEFAYLDFIKISDLNLYYLKNVSIPLFTSLDGKLSFHADQRIRTELSGQLGGATEENINVNGEINYVYKNSYFNIDIAQTTIPKRKYPYDLNVTDGQYNGTFRLDINRFGDKDFKFFGYFDLDDFSAITENRYIDNLDAILSINGGDLFFNKFSGKFEGIPFDINGSIYNIFDPTFDIYAQFENLGDENCDKIFELIEATELIGKVSFGKKNMLSAYFSGKDESISTELSLVLEDGRFEDFKIDKLSISAETDYETFAIDLFKLDTGIGVIEGNGYYHFDGKQAGDFLLIAEGDGRLFSLIPESDFKNKNNYNTKFYSEILKDDGKLSIKGDLRAKDLISNDLDFDLKVESLNDLVNFNIKNQYGLQISDITYNLKTEAVSFKGKNPNKLISRFNSDYAVLPDSIIYDLSYHNNKFDGMIELDNGSFYDGVLSFNSPNGKETNFEWFPKSVGLKTPEAKFSLYRNNNKFSVSNIFINNSYVGGEFIADLSDNILDGNILIDSFDVPKSLGIENLSSNTDIDIKLFGDLEFPKFNIKINENGLQVGNDNKKITGQVEIYNENSTGSTVFANLVRDNEVILDLNFSGDLESEMIGEMSGEFSLDFLAPLIDTNINGAISYFGNLFYEEDRFSMPSFYMIADSLGVDDFILDFTELELSIDSDNGVNIKNLYTNKIGSGFINVNASGNIPFDDSEMDIKGDFRADILSYLVPLTDVITKAKSDNKGIFNIKGRPTKPKLDYFEVEFIDGSISLLEIVEEFSQLRGKFIIDKDNKLQTDNFRFITTSDKRRGELHIVHGLDDFEDITFPLGINAGTLGIRMPDGGMTGRIPAFFKHNTYSLILLTGHDGDLFYVGKRNGDYTLSGKMILKDSYITFPLSSSAYDAVEGEDDWTIMDFVNFDIEIIPSTGNNYIYDVDVDKRSVWSRFVSAFNLSADSGIRQVKIPITASETGVYIKGFHLYPDKFEVSGEVKGVSGELQYSALRFDIEEASVRFTDSWHNGEIDPYIHGIGKKRIRTVDETGYVDFEDIYIHVVSKDEEGNIIDFDGAKLSQFSVEVLDENGNLWFSGDAEKVTDIDTDETVSDIFNEAIDARVFGTLLAPLEEQLGRLLGAYVTIRPNVTKNIRDDRLIAKDTKVSFGNYIEGSEVYITKFLTERTGVTFHATYIGEDEIRQEIERRFGYKSEISLDFRFTDNLSFSTGYLYNSLTDKEGVNFSLKYRYKFMDLKEELALFRRFRRRIAEEFY